MVSYKVTNRLNDVEGGGTFKVVAVFESFEGVADKIVADLNSLWNRIVPFPYNVTIELADDDEEKGMFIVENGKVIAKDDNVNNLGDFMQLHTLAMKNHYGQSYDLEKGGKHIVDSNEDFVEQAKKLLGGDKE